MLVTLEQPKHVAVIYSCYIKVVLWRIVFFYYETINVIIAENCNESSYACKDLSTESAIHNNHREVLNNSGHKSFANLLEYMVFNRKYSKILSYTWRMKDQLDVTCYILFHFLCAQHVSNINISIIRSLRLCWITTSVVLFSVRCVLELWCGWF